MRIAIIIPALNEEESLPHVLRDLAAVNVSGVNSLDVIVVDNGSTDSTPNVAKKLGANVVHQPRRGYGGACQKGMEFLRGNPPDILVILDGDHSDHVEDLGSILEPIIKGDADFVMGDRTKLAVKGALFPQQRFGNWLATWLMLLKTGHKYEDMGPFRAIRWGLVESMMMRDLNWGWNVEMQMKALKKGARVLEVPVRYRPRIGQSKVSGTINGSVNAGIRIIWAVWRYS